MHRYALPLGRAISKYAKADGASFRFNAEVQSIEARPDGKFHVAVRDVAEGGSDVEEVLVADAVVNCAGLWSRKFSNALGMHHPALVIEHQYAITEAIPELKGKLGDGERVPVIRDLAGSSYIRQERDGLLVGPYEEGVHVRSEWAEGPPANFAFDLFPPALDRIEDCLAHAMEVVPALGSVGIKSIVNGPTIWTGDSLARCGRTKLPGYYDFNSLTYGVAQSLALSEYLAHIIVEGEQPHDMATEFDPLRYGWWANDAYTKSKIVETYSHNNSISYPHENRAAGREHVDHPPHRRALYDVLKRHGALLGFSNAGVEVPIAFMPECITPEGGGGTGGAGVTGGTPSQKSFFSHAWAPAAEREAAHLLEAVGIGYSSFSKLSVRSLDGSDAATRLLEHCTTNALPKAPGRCRLTYATTKAGKLLAEFTITRKGEKANHDFYLVGSRDYAEHDLTWIEQRYRALVAAGEIAPNSVGMANVTDDIEILHVAGAQAADLMSILCPETESVPFLQMRELTVCGILASVFRISFTGEAGFELHVAAGDVAELWARITSHEASLRMELAPFGSMAVNSLRIEKAFRVKGDLDYAHWTEAGIEPFVALGRKNETIRFLGRDSPPTASRRHGVFAVETSEEHAWSVPGDSPVLNAAGEVIGFTTTSAKGAVTGRTIALGYVRHSAAGEALAAPGEPGLTVECYGYNWPVELLEQPPVAVGGRPEPKTEPVAVAA